MKWISQVISKWLVTQNAIGKQDGKLYEYAVYSFLITVTPLITFLIISSVLGMFVQAIVIAVSVMILRRFGGGYHAKNVHVCFIISIGLLLGSLYIVNRTGNSIMTKILMISCATSLWINSPVKSKNRRLEEDEVIKYKKNLRLILCILMALYVWMVYAEQSYLATCIAIGIILAACLQIPCFIEKYFVQLK